MIRITILGSTGTVGQAALDVVKTNLQSFKVIALVANKSFFILAKQCLKFSPKYVALLNEKAARCLRVILNQKRCKTKVLSGISGVYELASLDEVDQVISAITGISGLMPTLFAIRKGKRILLANKESLVTSGKLFFNEVKKYKAQVLPIDSEHNFIFQSLPFSAQMNLGFMSPKDYGIQKIVLTGSGGPFYKTPISYFKSITPHEACNHPNWSMGKKISVDSATMINKGFEYIEACHFFNISKKDIQIVIHPQSIVHSLVYYLDGSVIAQLAIPDMKIPISYGMFYPKRVCSGIESPSFHQLSSLEFIEIDYNRYPCLKLAIDACHHGQAASTILNAANEVSVVHFLKGKLQFLDIVKVNLSILEKFTAKNPDCFEDVLEIDREARYITIDYIRSLNLQNLS